MEPQMIFKAQEYDQDSEFREVQYCVSSDPSNREWTIYHDGEELMKLGSEYEILRTMACGVCSTDLARAFLPYPLPQVIGHEAICHRLDGTGQPTGPLLAVEINSSHVARGLSTADCPMCSGGLPSHCPSRITLGIDRLPGGFAQYLLAPTHSIHAIPATIHLEAAALTEPFAAALNAVSATPPRNGERVAVLGARRLGLLVVVALSMWRRSRPSSNFCITVVERNPLLKDVVTLAGCDEFVVVPEGSDATALGQRFDVIYDCTGNPGGLEQSLAMARRAVHLKTTCGLRSCGLQSVTDAVVDELAICSADQPLLAMDLICRQWARRSRTHALHALITPTAAAAHSAWLEAKGIAVDVRSVEDARAELEAGKGPAAAQFGRYDVAVVSSVAEIDLIVRSAGGAPPSVVRPRGVVCLECASGIPEPLASALAAGVSIETSRCGDFASALDLMSANAEQFAALARSMITRRIPLERMGEAFAAARDPSNIKVLVSC